MEKIQRFKPRSKTQLSYDYGVDIRTLNKWLLPFLDDIGEYRGGFYTPKQMELIYSRIGLPLNCEIYA